MAQTGIDLDIFNMLAGELDKDWTIEQLGNITGAESALLSMSLTLRLTVKTWLNLFQTAF